MWGFSPRVRGATLHPLCRRIGSVQLSLLSHLNRKSQGKRDPDDRGEYTTIRFMVGHGFYMAALYTRQGTSSSKAGWGSRKQWLSSASASNANQKAGHVRLSAPDAL
jgi:hypothetical protein